MTNDRYNQLNGPDNVKLTLEEARAGWHWCQEWDYLLVGPGMPELDACLCPEGQWAKKGGT